jgi:hypothetical protein
MNDYSQYILALYFLSVFWVLITKFINTGLGNFFALIVSFITFLIASFRPSHFPDMETYKRMFIEVSAGPEYWAESHGELGYKILSYIFYQIWDDFAGFLLFIALLSYASLVIISKISKVPFSYLWFTYFSFYFVTRDLGTMRLALACHLIVIALLQRKIIWQFFILVIASLTFQYYAFVAISASILSRIKPTLLLLIYLMIPFAIIGASGILDIYTVENSFLASETMVEAYIQADYNSNRGLPVIIPTIRNLFFALLLFYLLKEEVKFRKYRIWVWSAFLSVLTYLLFADFLIVAQRFSAYFGAIVPLGLAYLLNKKNFSLQKFSLIFFSVLINFFLLFYYNDFVWQV